MKKLSFAILAAAIALLPACKSQNNNTQDNNVTVAEPGSKEDMAKEELKVNLDSLVKAVNDSKCFISLTDKDGASIISDQEKLVKPEYLCDPASINTLETLTQKYRALAMLWIDVQVAEMFDMQTKGDYNNAIAKLAADLNDASLKCVVDADSNADKSSVLSQLLESEYNNGREQFFWETIAAASVETVFLCSQNPDLFLKGFTDKAAEDVTYRFILCHDNLVRLQEMYPEMASLDEVLKPLYVINAINVEQLHEQMVSLKEDIAAVRNSLLK